MSKLTEAIGKTPRHVKFDHEIKVQGRIVFMYVLMATLIDSCANMLCQCKSKKKNLWAGHESAQTDGQAE